MRNNISNLDLLELAAYTLGYNETQFESFLEKNEEYVLEEELQEEFGTTMPQFKKLACALLSFTAPIHQTGTSTVHCFGTKTINAFRAIISIEKQCAPENK